MGSWNATCGITQLPITDGQRVAVIPLVVKQQDFFERDTLAGSGSTSNTIIAEPFSLPLFGVYDGYGGVKLDKNQLGTAYLTEQFTGLVTTGKLLEQPGGTPKPVKRVTRKMFERLLDRELLVSVPNIRKMGLEMLRESYDEMSSEARKGMTLYKDQLAVDLSSIPDTLEFALGAMLVPEALYQSLVAVAGADESFGYYDDTKKRVVAHKGGRRSELLREVTMSPAQKKKVAAAVDQALADGRAEGLPPPTDKDRAELTRLALFRVKHYIARLNEGSFFYGDSGEQAVAASLLQDDEQARTLWVDFMLFVSAMNAMRKHWAPQAGAGSSCALYEVDKYYRATHQFVGEALAAAEADVE
jgi:hypothetical protein